MGRTGIKMPTLVPFDEDTTEEWNEELQQAHGPPRSSVPRDIVNVAMQTVKSVPHLLQQTKPIVSVKRKPSIVFLCEVKKKNPKELEGSGANKEKQGNTNELKPINLLEKGVGTAKKDPGKKKRKEGEEKEKIPELTTLEQFIDPKKKKRGRPRNEDRLPEIIAVEERQFLSPPTTTRGCCWSPFPPLPNPTKKRDPLNPKPAKVPMRLIVAEAEGTGILARQRGRPKRYPQMRGKKAQYYHLRIKALLQLKGRIPPIIQDPEELEKLAKEAEDGKMLEEYTNPTPKPKKRRTLGSKFAQPYIPPKPRKVKVPEGQPKKKKRRTTILMPEVFIRNKKAKLRKKKRDEERLKALAEMEVAGSSTSQFESPASIQIKEEINNCVVKEE